MSEPRLVYVVIGSCGDYSDGREWPVAAYETEQAAADAVVRLTSAAKNLRAADLADDCDDILSLYGGDPATHPWIVTMATAGDPSFQWCDSRPEDTTYSHAAVELRS